MNNIEKDTYFKKYNNSIHLIGKIGTFIMIVLFIAAPFLMGLVVGAMPNLQATIKGLVQVVPVYIVTAIAEFLIFVPILGVGGSYLAFITGNLTNIKIPCAINGRDIANTHVGTPENEIVSTLSIATSALVTTTIIAIGVILMTPLQPLLQSPILEPAFNNVVPALFGALGYKYFKGNMKIAAFPLIFMSVLCIVAPSLIRSVGFLIIPSGAIAVAIATVINKKNTKIN